MLPVTHSVAKPTRQLCHIESTFIQVQVYSGESTFRRMASNAARSWLESLHRKAVSLSADEHGIVFREYSLRERSPENIVSEASEISAPSTFNLIRTEIYSALILRRETASRNCYWFYSERTAQNFNDDVWNGRNKGPNPKMRQRR